MKKLAAMLALTLLIVMADAAEVSAEHVFCCNMEGENYYIDTETIYDSRPSYFVDVIYPRSAGERRHTWRFYRDEGTLWCETFNHVGKVYDNEFYTAVYLKMKENLHLAKRGAPSGFRGYRR